MGALPEEDKPALLDEQHSLKDAQATWGGTIGVLSIGLAFNPLLVVLPLTVGAISITVLRRKQNAVERLLADPPRFDYETGTRARRRRYVPGTLGDDQLAVATDQAALATLRAAAYLEASVRADERSQGARIAGREDLVSWHLEEARHLTEVGKRWSGEMSVALNALAMSWAAFAVDAGLDELPLADDVQEEGLPPQAREAVGRTGLVVDDFVLSAPQPDEERATVSVNRLTVGDIALKAAITARAVAWSAGKVAEGRRALPSPVVEERTPPSAGEYQLALRARERGDTEEAQRRLLPVAEQGSANAMFELGTIAYAIGDRVQARTWLDRAAARNAPMQKIEFQKLIYDLPDYEQLPKPRGELEGPGDEEP